MSIKQVYVRLLIGLVVLTCAAAVLDGVKEAGGDMVDGAKNFAEDTYETIKTQFNNAKEFMSGLPKEAMKQVDVAKDFFADHVKSAKDLVDSTNATDLEKRVMATETMMWGLKQEKSKLKEDASEAELKALNSLDANLRKINETKTLMAKETNFAAKQKIWNNTVQGFFGSGDMEQYIAMAGCSAITASVFVIVTALVIAYYN